MVDKKSVRELYEMSKESMNDFIVQDNKYKEIVSKRNEKRKLIENCYNSNDIELLEEYLDIHNEVVAIELEEYFVHGFSAAIQLIIDSLR